MCVIGVFGALSVCSLCTSTHNIRGNEHVYDFWLNNFRVAFHKRRHTSRRAKWLWRWQPMITPCHQRECSFLHLQIVTVVPNYRLTCEFRKHFATVAASTLCCECREFTVHKTLNTFLSTTTYHGGWPLDGCVCVALWHHHRHHHLRGVVVRQIITHADDTDYYARPTRFSSPRCERATCCMCSNANAANVCIADMGP